MKGAIQIKFILYESVHVRECFAVVKSMCVCVSLSSVTSHVSLDSMLCNPSLLPIFLLNLVSSGWDYLRLDNPLEAGMQSFINNIDVLFTICKGS